ncbi:hypothetical protein D9757_009751 [Collybiopsis confluens]|uniref:Uncharacterized protein n=1 Tax=Collybiopsis confluens TaxID=2823264 RepID=A0A8H5GYN2_9AGAR|nr:hypothetical protein D9757_009751 [Collybiopsis confluens]
MTSSASPPSSAQPVPTAMDPLSLAATAAVSSLSSTERPADTDAEPEISIPPNLLNDPPPPYPHPSRVRRIRGIGRRSSRRVSAQQALAQAPSTESESSSDLVTVAAHRSPRTSLRPLHDYHVQDVGESETTPLLGVPGPSHGQTRPRSLSQSSINSFAPSLASFAQTAWVFFSECESDQGEDGDEAEADEDEDCRRRGSTSSNDEETDRRRANPSLRPTQSPSELPPHITQPSLTPRRRSGFFSLHSWKLYFRPLSKPVYWRSFTHLVLLNFPFALGAWVYLFVFTVTGTTLLIALPLGAILCFFNLLGARTFARAELILQTKFHRPLQYPQTVIQCAEAYAHQHHHPDVSQMGAVDLLIAQYPIFTRTRAPSASELEIGRAVAGEEVVERSFYRNTWGMFASPTSFTALFYFLIIKPSITLLFTLLFLVVLLPLMVLVIPAPMVLRVVRRIGRWQAVVAVEGLVVGVK